LAKAQKLVDEKGQESWETALAYTCIALAQTPDSLPCKWIRAFALDKLKQYSFAISDWTACIDAKFRAGSSAMKLGIAHQETHQYEQAIKDFSRILDGDLWAHSERGADQRI
jgi:tetratricopeptide (TPR) repeat protein